MLTLTDRSSTGVRNLSVNSLNRGNIDCDVTINRTFTSGDRNGIDGLVVIVSNSLNRDGRSAVNLGTSLVEPSVGGVLIREAVDIGIQGDELAFANIHLVSIHLEVRTNGVDVDGLNRGTNLIFIGSGNRVDTGNRGGEFSTLSLAIAPSIGVFSLRINRSSGDRSLSTIADDVVASERKLRSSIHSNSSGRHLSEINRKGNFNCFTINIITIILAIIILNQVGLTIIIIRIVRISIRQSKYSITRSRNCSALIKSRSRHTTILVNSHHRVGVRTSLIQVHGNGVQVLTRDLDSILEPNEIGSIRSSHEGSLATSADNTFLRSHLNLGDLRQSVNRDVNGTFHRAALLIHCRSDNRVNVAFSSRNSGNGGTGGRNQRALTVSLRPSVLDVLIHETIEVSVQDNHLAGANFHSVSIDLEVGTVGIDVEGLNSGANIIGSGNRVGTSNRSSEFITFRIVTPNIIVISLRINRSSGDRSRSTITDDVVTRERELRSSVNRNGLLIRNRGSVATFSNSLHCEGVLTSSKHINRQVLEVMTRNLNTVHVPNKVRSLDFIITVGLNTSSQVNLSTSADFLFTIIFDSGRDSNRSSDIDVKGSINGATINLTSAHGNREHMTVFSSRNRNRGIITKLLIILIGPNVGDILGVVTIEISVQNDILAVANIHLVSINLQVRTNLHHIELSSSGTTALSLSSNRIDTRNISVNCFAIILSLAVRQRPVVFVGLTIVRCNRDGVLFDTGANHTVTRDRQHRSSVHGDRLVSFDSFGRSADKTLGFCSKDVGTGLIQRKGNLSEVLAFNSDTIHIPSVEVVDLFVIIISGGSGHDNLFTSADGIFTFRRSNRDFDVSQLLVNHVNRDRVNNFTILVSSSSSSHIIGRGSIRLNGKRRTHIIINRPLISNNLRVETIEISIQHNGSAGAHILSGSGNLEVSTHLINSELSGSGATVEGSRNRIDTRSRNL